MSIRSLIIALIAVATARAEYYPFRMYGEAEGLTNLSVRRLLQDHQGFLWVGTENGLYRFDGLKFRREPVEGLITHLIETDDGSIWASSLTGVYRCRNGEVTYLALPGDAKVSYRTALATTNDGIVWIATSDGLFRLIYDNGSNVKIQSEPIPGYRGAILGVAVTRRNHRPIIWAGCGDKICRTDGNLWQVMGTEEGVPPGQWGHFTVDDLGGLWAKWHSTLIYLAPRATHFEDRTPRGHENLSFEPSFYLTKAGSMLLADRQGLAILDRGEQRIRTLTPTQGLPDFTVSDVIQDREGNIWLGFMGGGIARWLGYGTGEAYTAPHDLPHGSIWKIASIGPDKLLLGSLDGLIEGNRKRDSNGRLAWKFAPLNGVKGLIVAISPSVHGGAWIGSSNGLRFWDSTRRQFGPFYLQTKKIQSLAEQAGKVLWAASTTGLFRADLTKTPLVFEAVSFGQPNLQPQSISIDSATGDVWVPSKHGLFVLHNTGRVEKIDPKLTLSPLTFEVAPMNDGSIWVSYEGSPGLSRLRRNAAGEFVAEHFTQREGLVSNAIYVMMPDPRGWLWIGTDHGVGLFDGHAWCRIDSSDGLVWNDINAGGLLVNPYDRSLWVGTSRGLSHFANPENFREGRAASVSILDAAFGTRHIHSFGTLAQVNKQDNSLTFTLGAAEFLHPETLRFFYRLQTTDAWRETENRELLFPSLPAGTYRFEVKTGKSGKPGEMSPTSLSFQILPAWWETAWARAGFLVALAGLIVALAYWRMQALEKERRALAEAVELRTIELAQKTATVEQLLEEARQASTAKSQFLANMSHEIRTPMNGVIGMINLAFATELSAEQHDYLVTAKQSGESLLGLINDILDLSKIEAGKLEVSAHPFDLPLMFKQIVAMFSFRAAEKGVGIKYSVAENVGRFVLSDDIRVRQVLVNLTGNALKFTKEGQVSLHVERRADGLLEFVVEDTGVGIPADKCGRIFEAFEQADGSTVRQYGGTGLGLSISRRLVELMGGQMWLTSEVNVGSRFCFDLPAPVAQGAEAPVEETNETNSNGFSALRILVAEDNPVNLKVATRLLTKRGHQVEGAGNGEEALKLMRTGQFDLVLMDIQMPVMDGVEAVKRWRAEEGSESPNSHLPIIALTANAMSGDEDRYRQAGMDAFISKPFDPQRFFSTIENCVAQQKSSALATT